MLEARGNLWDLAKPFDAIVITTNGFVKNNGECVMGRGIAKEAAIRHPQMPLILGRIIRAKGNHVHRLPNVETAKWLVTMPVKHNWWEDADPDLIRRSAHELVELMERDQHDPKYPINHMWLPRPGCGNGRLNWADVSPIIAPILDDRFTVVTF